MSYCITVTLLLESRLYSEPWLKEPQIPNSRVVQANCLCKVPCLHTLLQGQASDYAHSYKSLILIAISNDLLLYNCLWYPLTVDGHIIFFNIMLSVFSKCIQMLLISSMYHSVNHFSKGNIQSTLQNMPVCPGFSLSIGKNFLWFHVKISKFHNLMKFLVKILFLYFTFAV